MIYRFIRKAVAPAITAVILSIGLTTAAAQPADTPSPDAEPAATDESSEAQRGRRNNVALIHHQPLIQYVELAREAMQRQDFSAAVPMLERILDEPDSFIPLNGMSEVAAHEEVRRLFQLAPRDVRLRFEDARRAVAQKSWEAAREAGPAEVAAVLRKFGDLPTGLDALWWLATHERDQGRTQLAVSAYRQIAAHQRSTPNERATALIAAVDAFEPNADSDDLRECRAMLAQMDRNVAVRIGGKETTLAEWSSRTAAGPETTTRPNNDIDRLRRPLSQSVWKQQLGNVPSPLAVGLTLTEQKQRDQGLRPIPLGKPFIAAERAIVRTLSSIQAFRTTTGEQLWSVPNVEYQQLEQMNLFHRPGYVPVMIDWAQRRTAADSILTQLSADSRRLFVIQEPDRTEAFRNESRPLLRSGPVYNKLCCYSLATGTLEWELGSSAKGEIDRFGGCFFLGGPLALDGILYVMAQHENELELLVLDSRDAGLLWSVPLGSVSLTTAEDLQRSRVACPILFHDGLVICSTGAGALVAIDPLQRSLKWSYRYPSTTVSSEDLWELENSGKVQVAHEPWWDLWREPFLEACIVEMPPRGGDTTDRVPTQQSLMVFASPETDQLHAVSLPGGEAVWQVPRGGGLIVAGIARDLVLVIEGDFIRAHDVRTGEMRWRTLTGEASGKPSLVGSLLLLPLHAGGVALFDLETGKPFQESNGSDVPLGSLAEVESGWIAVNQQTISLLPQLKSVRQNVDQMLAADPTSETLRVQAALLDLQAGDATAASQRLEGMQSSPARELRRRALIDAVKEPSATAGTDRSDLVRQLKELAEDVDYKFAASAALAASSLAVNDLLSTVDSALEGLSGDLDQVESLVKSASVFARRDRILLGLIDEAYRRVKPEEASTLDQLFQARIKRARSSRDRFALQRLARQWRGIDWARKLVVLEEDRVFRKQSPADVELQLLDAAGSHDVIISLRALDKLATRLERPATAGQSRELRQQIVEEFAHTKFAMDVESEARKIVESSGRVPPSPSTWPLVEPKIEQLDDRTIDVYPQVPLHVQPGSRFEEMDLFVDRQGTEVIFRGGTFFQVGQSERAERKLHLPPTTSPYRGLPGYMLREAWGLGRVVILLVGTEIFAISPWDDRNEPNPRFLWSNPIELQWQSSDLRVVATAREGRQAIDQTNRPIGRIGPVRPGYLCYQKGNKLVAVDTETGRELWERLDLPKDVAVLGDDHQVFLWRSDHVVEVLSAVDGRLLEQRPYEPSVRNLLHQSGAFVWLMTQGKEVTLELTDFASGQSVWSASYAGGSQVGMLDEQTLAVAGVDGTLTLLSSRTGQVLGTPLSVNTEGLNGIATWQDHDFWYIALSRPTRHTSKLKSLQPNDAYRLRFLRGMLYAIDRTTRAIRWQRELKDEPLPTDISRASPLIVQIWKLAPKDQNSLSEGVLRVTDKRTGRILIDRQQPDLLPYFLLNPDTQQSIVEIKLTHETVRLHYSQDTP